MSQLTLDPAVVDQRERALSKANETRLAMGAVKRRVRNAPLQQRGETAARVLERQPKGCGGMEVGQLLRAVWPSKDSRHKLQQALAWSGIWFESKTLDDLTDRQRIALCAKLRGCATVEEVIANAQPPKGAVR